jgi:hypothetical protein
MGTKDNKTLFILLGIGLGIGVYYYLCKRKNESSTQNKSVEETTEQ